MEETDATGLVVCLRSTAVASRPSAAGVLPSLAQAGPMREVRTCDFCGADATGTYEPLPSTIPDAPRLLLCDGCRERLASVVDPLIDWMDGKAGVSGSGSEASGGLEGGRRTSGTAGSSRETDEAGIPPRQGGGTGDRGDAESRAGDSGSAATDAEGVDAGGRPLRDRGRTPPGYRKVMRFLENRELPIERSAAEQLAAEAYELDEGAVTAAIDHAVQYGRLREVDGELKR